MSVLGDLLGIELPIVQAPMAGVQGSALAIAVCNAGGLGSLPCAMLTPDGVRGELRAIRAATTRPFNVNFFCHTQPPADPVRDTMWRASLSRYYEELQLDLAAVPADAGRGAFDDAALELLREFQPPVLSFHFGLPSTLLLAAAKGWGAKILSTATTVAEARWLELRGVDAIIAQGVEAGGHRGMFLSDDITSQIGTLALVPQIVREVSVPVIAAGGIADARGVAAAMALGASGVQVGTAYLLCPEATTSAVHRAALQSPAGQHTALTNVFTGRPARGIVNRLIREVGPMSTVAPPFPRAVAAIMPLRSAAERAGRGDFTGMWAGQNTSGCKEIPAADLTRELAQGL